MGDSGKRRSDSSGPTLRSSLGKHDSGQRPGPTTEDSEEIERLKWENFELKRANEILRKASAFCAQAEHDREPGW